MEINRQTTKRVAEVYDRLDSKIKGNSESAGNCDACGKCCDFESFGHRLYVTTPEIIYLAEKLGRKNIKPMPNSKCPYNNAEGKCGIHENRFAGCRIFQCKGNSDLQSQLSEEAIKKFKSICREFDVPYRYTDLASALNSFDG